MSDMFSMEFPKTPLADVVKKGRREQLEAIRNGSGIFTVTAT